jgi:hypothetical protein
MKRPEQKVLDMFYTALLVTILIGCSKEDIKPEGGTEDKISIGSGVTENDFEKFEGEVGMVVNTRNVVKKGYTPRTAKITTSAQHGNYSQSVAIDPVSQLGQVKIAVEGLSSEAVDELKNGIPVTVALEDEGGTVILSQDLSAVIFKENPLPTILNVTTLQETPENQRIALKEGTPYYIQMVSETGQPENKAARVNRVSGYSNILTISTNNNFEGINKDPDFIFNFLPIPNEVNTYAIQLQADKRFVSVASFLVNFGYTTGPRLSSLTSFAAVQADNSYEFYKFIIRKENEGVYSLVSKPNNQVLRETNGKGLTIGSGNPIYFRIISNSLDWSVESISTNFLQPILGAPATNFGANSTLTNCGTGSLSQTIGADQAISTTNTIGWEERFAFTSTTTASVSTTIGAEFEAGFFGASAKYNASVTASLETSVSMTSESSSFEEFQETTSEAIFFERTVTVPPGKASLVYDVAQIYNDTKIQFVQRFRIRATEAGSPQSGEELRSQLQFSRFSGVVTLVGADFIDINIKGTATLGKVLEARSEVKDVASSCN